MTQEQITALREAAGKATKGPWKVYEKELVAHGGYKHLEHCIGTAYEDGMLRGPYPIVTVGEYADADGHLAFMVSLRKHNADFIAAADPSTILALLDELERVRREAFADGMNYNLAHEHWVNGDMVYDGVDPEKIRSGETPVPSK